MKIGYLLDTHGGPYNMPAPTGAQVTAFIDHLWREAEAAEQAGFDSLVVPECHVRTECLFPHRYGILAHHPGFRSESDFTVANCFRRTVAGSPQECVEQLAMYERDYDVDYVIRHFRLPAGPEHGRVPDCIQLFGEAVLSQFHEEQRRLD
jgi:alkanesulfonate monooxygenase SsuD/methylene tetrahydromethanopterin reductase-like flavin-dependent oxidoreductase (luciferase family)